MIEEYLFSGAEFGTSHCGQLEPGGFCDIRHTLSWCMRIAVVHPSISYLSNRDTHQELRHILVAEVGIRRPSVGRDAVRIRTAEAGPSTLKAQGSGDPLRISGGPRDFSLMESAPEDITPPDYRHGMTPSFEIPEMNS